MKNLESDAFVFFGATGDLAYEQIFPALQAMTRRGQFEIPIIGVGRSATDLEALRARAHESIEKHGGVDQRAFPALSAKLQYVKGDYSSPETFRELRKALGAASRPLYYLAIPPDSFAGVAEGLADAESGKGARLVVEKPFGRDLSSARADPRLSVLVQSGLHAARERMLMDGLDAASATFEVGYESASQFNREYSRFFGQPPMRDIRTLRSRARPMESVSNLQNAI